MAVNPARPTTQDDPMYDQSGTNPDGSMRTTMPVGTPQTGVVAPPGVSTTPGDPNYNPIYDPSSPYYGQPSGPIGSPQNTFAPQTQATSGPPTYDPTNPTPWINYYYNQEYGTNAPPDQIAYWSGKLASNDITGTGQPATPAYWATRILRQGYDDLHPPQQAGLMPLTTTPAPTFGVGTTSSTPAPTTTDTSWMQGTPPGPGWVAVPGVGWVPPDNPAAQAYLAQNPNAATPANATPGAPTNTPASIDDQMRTAIMGLLQTPTNIDAASLQTDPAVEAYNIASTRAADQSRAQAVESAITGGTYGSGALETQKGAIAQQQAEGQAQFVGQIAMQKLQANRQQVAEGIQFAQSMGQFDKAQQLQLQLAQMDQAIREAQIAQSGQLGNRSLDLQQLSEAQQLQEFLDSLGFNYTQLGITANEAASQPLLPSSVGG